LIFASIKSIASYIPKRALSNSELEKIVDTSDEWITKRTGIKNRFIADDSEVTSDLAYHASIKAIERANLTTKDIDMIIVATITPDYFCMPSTACMLSHKRGIKNIPAYDISAACTGFIYALANAKAFIESGMKKNILVVGAETISRIIDYKDRTTCVLFGDGAGASVVGVTKDRNRSILDINLGADGEYSDLLITPACGSKNPISQNIIDNELGFMKLKGNETFKIAVRTLTNDVKDILERNRMDIKSVDYFIPHQANYRIISAVGDALGVTKEQLVLTVDKYGNTSSASIPMAMNDIFENGKLQSGDMMLLDAFGGGLTWGSALVYFGG
jgi:3-oxoacyl-[acyl-carrier-protein] synthase-3